MCDSIDKRNLSHTCLERLWIICHRRLMSCHIIRDPLLVQGDVTVNPFDSCGQQILAAGGAPICGGGGVCN